MIGKLLHGLDRRRTIFSLLAITTAGIGSMTGLYSSVSFSQNSKRPSLSEEDLVKRVNTVLSGISEDAKIVGFPLKEDFIQSASKEIYPEVEFISERRFVLEK